MPYWRLSGFYLFYFATLGGLMPYWGLYLKALNFSPVQIGELMAMLMVTRIAAPAMGGWLADQNGRPMLMVRLAALLTPLCFSGVFLGQGFAWLALVTLLFSFFWNASLPQLEAATLNHLGNKTHQYSMIRLWGSIGFIVTVTGLGMLFDQLGSGLLPVTLLPLMLGAWVMSLLIPEYTAGHRRQSHESLRQVLKRPVIMALLGACALMAFSHGPYYTFYSIYLQSQHYSRSLIGELWALGVVAEIGAFLLLPRFLPRFGANSILLWSFALASVRWMLIGLFPDSLVLLVIAQLLHAASFGAFHAAAIHLINHYFTGQHQARGQALYNSVGFGVGSSLGSLFSGYSWVAAGPQMTFFIAALASACAYVVGYRFLRERS